MMRKMRTPDIFARNVALTLFFLPMITNMTDAISAIPNAAIDKPKTVSNPAP